MAIIAADLKLFGSLYPLDVAYGGGRMSSYIVVDGTNNNVFPNISDAARVLGRVYIRKVFAAVVSANADTLMDAQIDVKTPPADSAVRTVAFARGDQLTTRDEAESVIGCGVLTGDVTYPFTTAAPNTTFAYASANTFTSTANPFTAGMLVGVWSAAPAEIGTLAQVLTIQSVSGSGPYTYTTVETITTTIGSGIAVQMIDSPSALRVCGVTTTTATSSTASVAVSEILTRIVPNATVYPVSVEGFAPIGLKETNGRVPIFRVGDEVVLRNGATTENAIILSINYYTKVLTFTANLANSYASGTKVSALLQLGDVQASVGVGFSQQTWTKLFRDSLIGNPISANYDRNAGGITTTNIGGETERWAIVFTSSTAFKLIGELVGQIATGVTTSDFAPLNPITNQPYFTLDKDGWGSGWGIGNVLRFNTIGARAPFWMLRTVHPSSPGSADAVTLDYRGTV